MKEDTKHMEVVISLLGRALFPEERLKALIVKKKRNPESYLRGYNACNGKNRVTDIAKIVGVSQPTMTTILQSWESLGIIYETESLRGKTYSALYPLIIKEDNSQEEPKEKNGETMGALPDTSQQLSNLGGKENE